MESLFKCGGRISTHCDKDLDAKIDAAATLTGTDRVKAYQKQAQQVYDDALAIPLFRIQAIFGLSKRLNFTPRTDGLMPVQEMSLTE